MKRGRKKVIGAFLLFVMIVTALFIGFYLRIIDYNDLIYDFIGVKEDVVDDVDIDFPDGDPFYVMDVPDDSFGFNGGKFVNKDYFKQHLNNVFDWSLNYKRYEHSNWKNGNQYLDIGKSWDEDGFFKITLGFDAPVDVYQAEFVLNGYIECLDYVDNENDLIKFSIPANDTERFDVFFNYSDLKDINGLYFFKDLNETNFRFGFGRYNIPSGYWEFDPNFGYEGIGAESINIEDTGYGSRFNCTSDQTIDSITAYLSYSSAKNTIFAIYAEDSGNLLGQSDNTEVSAQTDWVTLNLQSGVDVKNGNVYVLMACSDGGAGTHVLKWENNVGSWNIRYRDPWSFPNVPTKLTSTNYSADICSIYCTYTAGESPYVNTHPTVSCVSPVNGSTYSGDFAADVSFCVNDSDGNGSKVQIFESLDGVVYTEVNVSLNVLNESIRYRYDNATGWATKYFWKVLVNDGLSSVEYWYEFTNKNYNDTNVSWGEAFLKNEDPVNGTADVDCSPGLMFEVYIQHNNSNTSNINWYWSYDVDSFPPSQGNNNSVVNETVRHYFTNWSSVYGTKVWVQVAVDNSWDHKNYKFWFITANHPGNVSYSDTYPTITAESPSNNSVDVSITTNIGFTINDDNSTIDWEFNLSWTSNGTEIYNKTGSGVGRKIVDIPDLVYFQNYTWNVTMEDNNGSRTFYSFNFTTVEESDIELSIEYICLIIIFLFLWGIFNDDKDIIQKIICSIGIVYVGFYTFEEFTEYNYEVLIIVFIVLSIMGVLRSVKRVL